jgi:hypothetical protein
MQRSDIQTPKLEFILILIILVFWGIKLGSRYFTYPDVLQRLKTRNLKIKPAGTSNLTQFPSVSNRYRKSHLFMRCLSDFPAHCANHVSKTPESSMNARNCQYTKQSQIVTLYRTSPICLSLHRTHLPCEIFLPQSVQPIAFEAKYSRVCYYERSCNERMLQGTVFINKIGMLQRTQMLQRTRRNTTVSFF